MSIEHTDKTSTVSTRLQLFYGHYRSTLYRLAGTHSLKLEDMLKHSFTAYMPLLMAATATGLGEDIRVLLYGVT